MHFQNPNVLYFLGLALLPIIIHLLKLRQYKTIYYSNVTLLKNLHKEQRKKKSLLEIIVLLCRTLAIVAVVLAFAKPIRQNSKVASTDKNIVIFLDNSFSMEAIGEHGVLFEEAKNNILAYVKHLSKSNRYALLTNNAKGNSIHFVSREEMIKQLSTIRLQSKQMEIEEVLKRIELVGKKSQKISEVLWLSDFQKRNLSNEITKPLSYSIKPMLLSAKKRSTLSLDSLWFKEPIHRPNHAEQIQVHLTNHSENSFSEVPIRLFVNDSLKGLTSINIDANATKELTLHYTNQKSGTHKIRVEFDDFPIQYDNIVYESYVVQEKVHLLSLQEQGEENSIQVLFNQDSNFDLVSTPISQVTNTQIAEANFISIVQPDQISSGVQTQLVRFVENGGRLAIFPNETVNIKQANKLLNILGVNTLMQLDTTNIRLGSANLENNFYNEVFKKGSGKGITPYIKSHWVYKRKSQLPNETILNLANGSSLVSQFWRGKGSIIVAAFPLKSKENSFSQHPLSIPLFYNIALSSTPSKSFGYTIGEDRTAILFDIKNENSIEIVQEGEKNEIWRPEIKRRSGGDFALALAQFSECGFYNIVENEKSIYSLALNYSREESNDNFYTENELKNRLKNQQVNWELFAKSGSIDSILSENKTNISIWQWLIATSLLFLCLEMILLARFIQPKNNKN